MTGGQVLQDGGDVAGGGELMRQAQWMNLLPPGDDGGIGIYFPHLNPTVAQAVIDSPIIHARQLENFQNLSCMRTCFHEPLFLQQIGGVHEIGMFLNPVAAEKQVARRQDSTDTHHRVFSKKPIGIPTVTKFRHQEVLL